MRSVHKRLQIFPPLRDDDTQMYYHNIEERVTRA